MKRMNVYEDYFLRRLPLNKKRDSHQMRILVAYVVLAYITTFILGF